MGYTTSFTGDWTVTPPLEERHRLYLNQFAESRRMARDPEKAEKLPDPLRIAVGLPIGYEGAYYVGTADKFTSQFDVQDDSVINGNEPPGAPRIPSTSPGWWTTYLAAKATAHQLGIAQPGLWCQWIPNEEGTRILWDDGEKFYEYTEWIEYLLAHFLIPWGYTLNGQVYWEGEESLDQGLIEIVNNVVAVKRAHITYR